MSQADTPPVLSLYAGPPQDQDEKGSQKVNRQYCAELQLMPDL
jgi:hypothetical protein